MTEAVSNSAEGNVTEEAISTDVLVFIRSNFLFDGAATLDRDQSLLGSGILDSTGILELISFLGSTYDIKFRDDELVADNFDTLRRISTFVMTKVSNGGR